MPINEADVKLTYTTSNTPPASPDTNTIYFCNGSKTLWVGNTQYGLLELSKSATNSFTDGIDSLFKDVKANIQAVQAGSGTPSPNNVRIISGFTECTVTDNGKNILPLTRTDTMTYGPITFKFDNTKVTVNGTSESMYPQAFQATGIKFKKGTYTLSKTIKGTVPTGGYIYTILRNSIFGNIAVTRSSNYVSFTLTEDIELDVLIVAEGNNLTWNNVEMDMQLEVGSIATDYTPYVTPTTATISFGSAGTVYGGTVDLTTGVLTVTYGYVDLGSLNWSYGGSGSSARFQTTEIPAKRILNNAVTPNFICSNYDTKNWQSIGSADKFITRIGGAYDIVAVVDSDYTDATTFTNAMNGVQLVYELATPQTYQLTPAQLRSLVGTNNLTSNTGDTVDVEYITNETIAWLLDNTVRN